VENGHFSSSLQRLLMRIWRAAGYCLGRAAPLGAAHARGKCSRIVKSKRLFQKGHFRPLDKRIQL
jgi:hypothetical protein